MEDGESILDVIQEEAGLLEDDVDMLDVEEGELTEVHNSRAESGEIITENHNQGNTSTISKNRKRKSNKKRNKKKKCDPGSGYTDVNRFVLDVCRRLKEKKSYLVYSAVGCLGISVLCDLVKEVETIQACGGQKTADGNKFRTGGGILWNVLKTREPNAYREIMKRGKEFEKQFRQSSNINGPVAKKDNVSQMLPAEEAGTDVKENLTRDSQNPTPELDQREEPNSKEKRVSVHERIRVPVSYDDLFGDEGQVPTLT